MVLLGKGATKIAKDFFHKLPRTPEFSELNDGYAKHKFKFEDIFVEGGKKKFRNIAMKLKRVLNLSDWDLDEIRRFCEFFGTTFEDDGFLHYILREGGPDVPKEFEKITAIIDQYNSRYNVGLDYYNDVVDEIADNLADLMKPIVEDVMDSLNENSMAPADNIHEIYKPGELGGVDINWDDVMRQMRLDAMVSL